MRHDQARLAIGTEGESLAQIICQRNQVCGGFKEVGEERDAFGGFGVDELEDLWNLYDGRGSDDANAKAFGDGELDAVGGVDVDVEEEGLVAGLAKNGDAKVMDGSGEVVGYGLEGIAKRVHLRICEGLRC